MNTKHYQLIVLGSGPAGCTAAIYAARANLKLAMITGLEQGGQLTRTPKIANWPGEPEEISGLQLMEKMLNQVRNFNSNIINDNIIKVDLSGSQFFLQGGVDEYTCDALIIVVGASAKLLGLPSEQKYLGKGLSTCAVCDGFFYKNKEVVIVGGGNATVEGALYLAKIAKEVIVVHRRDSFRAEEWQVNRMKQISNVKFELNSIVTEILGNDAGVTGVKVQNVNTKSEKVLGAEGVFIAIGHKPNSEIFLGQLAMDHGYIKVGYNFATATSVAGVFAAGDIVADGYKQAIIAASSGCVAALDAKTFLHSAKNTPV